MTRPPKSPKKNFEELLAELLLSSENLHSIQAARSRNQGEQKWLFSPGDFFDKWFRQNGQAYYFLFRKNLKVTNIQFAELLSLIQSTAKSKSTGKPTHELQFLSVSDFYDAVSDIVDSFPRRHKNPRARYDLIARMYYSLLSRHIAVECFFGSCAVFIPPNLEIDLPMICSQSGYVHSCGLNIYTRKIDKAKKDEFFSAISRHLVGRNEKPLFFMTYAHEDFTKGERQAKKEYLKDGLDDVKIHIEKFYMDTERLVDVVEDMKKEFSGRLVLPQAGTKPSEAKLSNDQCDQTRMLWLLMDYSTGEEIQQRGTDRFYICYEQLYLNESPFQLFDENKPAWVAHTTIPHTLLSAMINLTGAVRLHQEPRVLSDPFVGSGTTWLEAMKLDNTIVRCTDKTPFAQLMADDNLHFFCCSARDLRKLQDDLEVVMHHLQRPSPSELEAADSASVTILADYNRAIRFYDEIVKKRREYNTALEAPRNIERLRNRSFFQRLLFYLTLRTIARSSAAIRHGSQEWDFAYAIQAAHLVGQIGLLIDVREREAKPVSQNGRFTIFQGVYSLSCTVNLETLLSYRKASADTSSGAENRSVGVFDVLGDTSSELSSLKPNSCDAVITDPPYGFNTDDDLQSLAELYASAIEKMILSLKQDGHLVLCLLDRSHTGRRSPFFTHKELITQQVLSLAERATPKREVVVPAYAVPKQKELFRPPYYWESERALRRAILHFRVRIEGD